MIKKIVFTIGSIIFGTSSLLSQNVRVNRSKKDTVINEPTIIYTDPSNHDSKNILDVEPVYPGGQKEMNIFVYRNLRYPKDAVSHNAQGLLLARLTIKKDGTAKLKEFIINLGYGCEEEVERIIKKMPEWTPALSKSKPVDSEYIMKVNFKLSN
jgi:hypothetical protein